MPCYHVRIGPGLAAIVCTRGTLARVHVDDGRGGALCGRGGASSALASGGRGVTCRVCQLAEQRAAAVAYAAPSLPFGAP